jgi:lipoate-protein ligase A
MHHGTLLFDTDTEVLSKALNPNKLKMQSKGIKSVKSRVLNLKELLPNMTFEQFKTGLIEKFTHSYVKTEFNEGDIIAIKQLVAEKYSQYEWNIGKSPKGSNNFEARFDFGTLKITFDTVEGKMQSVQVFGDFFSLKEVDELAKSLNGVAFNRSALLHALTGVGEYIKGATAEQILEKMF